MTQQDAMDYLNKLFAQLVGRTARFRYWREKGDGFAFAYTTEPTSYKGGKKGFYAIKYRVTKDGCWKVKKATRFGRRKIAKARASKWHDERVKELQERKSQLTP